MRSPDAQRLIHEVHLAFTSPPPRPDELIVDWPDPGEAAEIRAALRGKRWTAVPRDVPRRVRVALSWMKPQGRRHYLPLWLVEAFADADVRGQATFHTWYMVTDEDRRTAQLPLYTTVERRVVAACLRHFAEIDREERRQALEAAPLWDP